MLLVLETKYFLRKVLSSVEEKGCPYKPGDWLDIYQADYTFYSSEEKYESRRRIEKFIEGWKIDMIPVGAREKVLIRGKTDDENCSVGRLGVGEIFLYLMMKIGFNNSINFTSSFDEKRFDSLVDVKRHRGSLKDDDSLEYKRLSYLKLAKEDKSRMYQFEKERLDLFDWDYVGFALKVGLDENNDVNLINYIIYDCPFNFPSYFNENEVRDAISHLIPLGIRADKVIRTHNQNIIFKQNGSEKQFMITFE